MKIDQPIIGDNVYLKTLVSSSLDKTYVMWMNDPDVIKFLESRFNAPESLKDIIRFVDQCNKSKNTLLLGIFCRSSRLHIGNIKLGNINGYHQSAELGFLIGDKNYWGQGLASEAISLMCDFAFRSLKLKKLTAGCYEPNVGSARALIKCGFQKEGICLNQWKFGLNRVNGLIFGRSYDA